VGLAFWQLGVGARRLGALTDTDLIDTPYNAASARWASIHRANLMIDPAVRPRQRLRDGLRAKAGALQVNFQHMILVAANLFHRRPPLSEIYSDLILARLMPSGAVHTNRRLWYAEDIGMRLLSRYAPGA
jgi:hypothetical protein